MTAITILTAVSLILWDKKKSKKFWKEIDERSKTDKREWNNLIKESKERRLKEK
jgi:hypothetical protein